VVLKKIILMLAVTSAIYAGKSDLINIVDNNNKDIKRLNTAVLILINKVNKLTDTQKILLKKLNIKDSEIKDAERLREELYAQKLVQLRNLKAENVKAEKELKEYIKTNVQKEDVKVDLSKEHKEKITPSIEKTAKNIKVEEITKTVVPKIEDKNSTKVEEITKTIIPKIEDKNSTKVEEMTKTIIPKVEDKNSTKDIKVEELNTSITTAVNEDVKKTLPEDTNVKKYIIKLELTNEKRKKHSLKTISKIENKELRDNVIIRPIGKNKLIVETKIGYDYNTTETNLKEYKKTFKNLFIVTENKDRLTSKMVYVIFLGTVKSEKEKGYILRTIKKKELKKGISVRKMKKRYVAVSKDYDNYDLMKKDLKKYKKYFKGAYFKKELRKKDDK